MRGLEDKNILLTGASGSIGSQLLRRLLDYDPKTIRALDQDEHGLFQLKNRFEGADADKLRYLLGNIRDRDRLNMALKDIDVVFHAAALKHVELSEYNPFEAIKTNVQGTQNLIRAAIDHSVDSFIAISTDKASNPTSVMGATKLLSERLVIAANTYKGKQDSAFGCVRFGNVLGSNGSVVPILIDQIRSGDPLTVTDPEMTRFMMSPETAVDFVFTAFEQMEGGEVFISKMPGVCIGTLAEAVKEAFASEFGQDPAEVETELIGPRPGERKHEKLISADEVSHTVERDDLFMLYPQIDVTGYQFDEFEGTNTISSEYTSADADRLTQAEIVSLLQETSAIR